MKILKKVYHFQLFYIVTIFPVKIQQIDSSGLLLRVIKFKIFALKFQEERFIFYIIAAQNTSY